MGGCLAVLGIVFVVLVAAGIYTYMNWRSWAASGIVSITERTVADSGLPTEQQSEIVAEVKKLADDMRDGKISIAQLQRVGQEITQGPIIPLAAVQATRQKYIEPSDMAPEEKADAILALQRFARGIYEKKIPHDALDDVVKPITNLRPDGRWELQDNPKRRDLDQFIANVRDRADEAGIPNEPFDLNFAEELRKAIDRGLGKSA